MKLLLCALFGHKPRYSHPHMVMWNGWLFGWDYDCERCGGLALSSDRLIIAL